MRWLGALLLAFPASAQVRILATPEPMSVLRSIGLRDLGLWHLAVCNDGAASVALPRERLLLALPSVRIVSNDRARAVLEHSRGRTRKAVAARVVRHLLLGATAGAGAAQVPARAVGYLALGFGVADQVAQRLESEIPSAAPILAGLSDDTLTLNPGQCGSRTVFAALQTGARPVEAVVK